MISIFAVICKKLNSLLEALKKDFCFCIRKQAMKQFLGKNLALLSHVFILEMLPLLPCGFSPPQLLLRTA